MLLLALIVCWNSATHATEVAQTTKLPQKTEKKIEERFDIAAAQKQFDNFSLKLSTSKRSYADYVEAITQLESLKVQAQICVDESQRSLLTVDAQLDEQMTLQKRSDASRANYLYLREKREAILEKLSDCHLFVLRADEAIPIYKQSIQEMGRMQTFSRATPLWGFTPGLVLEFRDVMQKDGEALRTHIKQLAPWSIGLVLMFLLALAFGYGASKKCSKLLSDISKRNRLTHSFMATLGKSPIFLGIIIFGLFISGASLALGMPPFLKNAGAVFILLALYAVFLKILFVPTPDYPAFFHVETHLGTKLFRKGLIQAIVLVLGAIGIGLAETIELPKQMHDFIHMVCMLTIVIITSWFAWGLTNLKAVQARHSLASILRGGLMLVAITVGFLEVIGYQVLSVYLLNSLFATAVTLVLFAMAFYFVSGLLRYLLEIRFFASKPLRYYLGIKKGLVFWEGLLILYLCYALLLYALVLTLLLSWQVPYFFIFELISGAIHGFTAAGITLFPFKLLIAILLFALFNIVGRIISAYVLHQVQKTHEMRTQTALGTIIRYASFVIALFLALFIVEVDLTGIALIVGALSVGIGLGLKDVVNNFLSGLVLLVEKPIKQGDRISIEKVQGYVKKIGLRSTCITTDEQTDVIVPNASITSKPLTNFQLDHKYWGIECTVNVARKNSPEKIQQILLDLAKQHAEVVKKAPNQPKVSLLTIEAEHMLFELRCTIRDAAKKKDVSSDLNFAIEKAFREQKIQV